MAALDAAGVEALQNSQPPTDWNQFDRDLQQRSSWDANRFAQDSKLYVRFYMKARLNFDKSNEANRPIFEDCEYIEIMMPGEKHNIIQRPAWEQDYQRFHAQYKLFKEGQAEQLVGTSIKVLPFLSESQVEELLWYKIRTVEQLAQLSPNVQIMGGNELRTKAQAFLDKSMSNEVLLAQLNAMQAEFTELKKQQQAERAVSDFSEVAAQARSQEQQGKRR